MRAMIGAVVAAMLAAGLAGCSSNGEEQPAESTTSTMVSSSTPSSLSTTASSSTLTNQNSTVPSSSSVQANPTTPTVAAPAAAVPVRPPFMSPEDFDPYGPPRFVQCWESNAAVMSDGSIVTDTVNCAPQRPAAAPAPQYVDPPRADGCVGPAATCGYYDEDGNPIWFDKETGQTSPRYLDENGNPTMDPN